MFGLVICDCIGFASCILILVLNFLWTGEIGRYPIHFHLCNDVRGSLVAKNSIRYSNQRCIVVHGTHNLTISNNVAHETFGHCYMLEDGGELDNVFIRNLGASTRAATRLVRPFESDRSDPSTFWCSNPMNTWVGNVAGGSQSSGFWFELQDSVRPPTSLLNSSIGLGSPKRLPLKLFVDNVSHSNVEHGLRKFCAVHFVKADMRLDLPSLDLQARTLLDSNHLIRLHLTTRDRTRTVELVYSSMRALTYNFLGDDLPTTAFKLIWTGGITLQ
jgi:hypothetical protein